MEIGKYGIPEEYVLEETISNSIDGKFFKFKITFSLFGEVLKLERLFVLEKEHDSSNDTSSIVEYKINKYIESYIYEIPLVKLKIAYIYNFKLNYELTSHNLEEMVDDYRFFIKEKELKRFYQLFYDATPRVKKGLQKIISVIKGVHRCLERYNIRSTFYTSPIIYDCIHKGFSIQNLSILLLNFNSKETVKFLLSIIESQEQGVIELRSQAMNALSQINDDEVYVYFLEFYRKKTPISSSKYLAIVQGLSLRYTPESQVIIEEILCKFIPRGISSSASIVLRNWGVKDNEIVESLKCAFNKEGSAERLSIGMEILTGFPSDVLPSVNWFLESLFDKRHAHPFTFYGYYINELLMLYPYKNVSDKLDMYKKVLNYVEHENDNFKRAGIAQSTAFACAYYQYDYPYELAKQKIIQLINHQNVSIQEEVLKFIVGTSSKVNYESLLPILVKKAFKNHPNIKANALRAINRIFANGEVKEEMKNIFFKHLEASDKSVRAEAIQGLGNFVSIDVLQKLEDYKNKKIENNSYWLSTTINNLRKKLETVKESNFLESTKELSTLTRQVVQPKSNQNRASNFENKQVLYEINHEDEGLSKVNKFSDEDKPKSRYSKSLFQKILDFFK